MSGYSPRLRAFVNGEPGRRKAITAAVAQFSATLPNGARMLDVGAGSAPFAELFAHCVYTSQDWEHSVHGRAHDYVGDISSQLPIDSGTFDAIVCTEVLEHVAVPSRALTEIRRLLAPGGRLLITVPFAIALHEEPHDFWRFTPHSLRRLLEEAGFDGLEIGPLNGWAGALSGVLTDAYSATRRPDQDVRTAAGRFFGRLWRAPLLGLGLLVGHASPILDRLDRRRIFPSGWVAKVTVAQASSLVLAENPDES